MTETPADLAADNQALITLLQRKEGGWVQWGEACQKLQRSGYSPQTLFEQTGFEPPIQNQLIAAAQVYRGLAHNGAPASVLEQFTARGSEALYELRILTQPERLAAAELIALKNPPIEEVRELARALKDLGYLNRLPEGFTRSAGDAVAYRCWKLARQSTDLRERSGLIARGLRYAQSGTAREQLELLLTDFTVQRSRPGPRLPVYRPEAEELQPRILPVAGALPLAAEALKDAPQARPEGQFGVIAPAGTGGWAAVPGWQVIEQATDPVAVLCRGNQLGDASLERLPQVLVVIDRAVQQWDASRYVGFEQEGQLVIDWFESPPQVPLLGQIILVLLPRHIFDEEIAKDPWQIDE